MANGKLKKKWKLFIAVTPVLLIAGSTFYIYLTRNPYADKELVLQSPKAEYKLENMQWGTNKIFRNSWDAPFSPPINFPTQDKIHFANINFENNYQFAQTAQTSGDIWVKNQRLFWRKNNSASWNEIRVPIKLLRTEGFVLKNGRMYLAAIAGFANKDLYLIDLKSGEFKKQFQAIHMRISPDKKKLVFVREPGNILEYGEYTIAVWDLEDDIITPIATIPASDPSSGSNLEGEWSPDSNLLRVTGSTWKDKENPDTYENLFYIYNHSEKKLFNTPE